jgi:probable DNA metabolism protein
VLREYDKQRGFLRFSETEGGWYYAREATVSYQLPLLTPYFFDRMGADPFIIHDTGRRLAGVSDTREWRIVSAETFTAPDLSGDESDYRRLWRMFHHTIAIQSRLNPKLQSQLMPKRYWQYMTEMNEDLRCEYPESVIQSEKVPMRAERKGTSQNMHLLVNSESIRKE